MTNDRRFAAVALSMALLVTVSGCGRNEAASGSADDQASAPAAPAPAPDSVDTLDGTALASFTGDAAAGEKVFMACRACHAVEPGKNLTGPSMHAIQGRQAGTVPGYNYSKANRESGFVWTNEKLFQYLEKPQRVMPGTKMAYTGVKDPQQRADLIAYLDTLR